MNKLFSALSNVELNDALKLIDFNGVELSISPENRQKLLHLKEFLDLLDQGGHLR